jgi:hypothetical protein
MDPARRFAYCCLALIALAAFGGQAFATNASVGLCAAPGTHYTTSQAAVNAVPAGTKIDVCPGTYPEQVSITKNLTLIGIVTASGSDAAVIVSPSNGLLQTGTDIYGGAVAAQILVTGASAVTISHLTVDGSNNGLSGCSVNPIGIYYQNSAGTITYNAVRDQLMDPADQGCEIGLGINVESNTGSPAVTISDNSVRNYDKNGITAGGPLTSGGGGGGPVVAVSNNTVIGIGATSAIAQNGIQIGYGASGSVTSNDVADDIYVNPPCGGSGQPPCYGSSGILIYASSGVSVTTNTVESTQLAIAPATDPNYGNANSTIITSNHIGGTQNYDSIDLCSDGNKAETNIIYGSAQSGVHIDDECPPSTGSGNTVTKNIINEACAGVLLGSGTGNTYSPNTFANVTNTTLSGDVCTPLAEVKTGEKHSSFRPSPRKPNRE